MILLGDWFEVPWIPGKEWQIREVPSIGRECWCGMKWSRVEEGGMD